MLQGLLRRSANRGISTRNYALASQCRRPLATTPDEFYHRVVHSFFLPHAVHVACQLKLADFVTSAPATAADIALAADTDAQLTDRLLKFLAVHGVFERVSQGVYRHNSLSEVLRTDHPKSTWHFVMYKNEIGKKAASEWSDAIRGKSKTPFNKAFNTDLSLWEFLAQKENEVLKGYVDKAMKTWSGNYTESIVSNYPWSQHANARVVDVGGGMGHVLAALLRKRADFTGVVFDLPKTVQTAEQLWTAEYSDVKGRASFSGGSFFQHVPRGGDVYLLKHVLHNWTDRECEQILKNVSKAMSGTERPSVVVIDSLYDFPPRSTAVAEMDVMMLTASAGRERSLEEFKSLMAAAGLKCVEAVDLSKDISAVRAELVAP